MSNVRKIRNFKGKFERYCFFWLLAFMKFCDPAGVEGSDTKPRLTYFDLAEIMPSRGPEPRTVYVCMLAKVFRVRWTTLEGF